MGSPSKLCEFPALVARAAAVVGEASRARPARGGFALVEHLWHLADLETDAFQARIARLSRETSPWLPDFDGDRIAAERRYLARSAAAGLRAFARARAATVHALGQIRGPTWLRGGIQDQVGYVTLGELPERILGHDKSHAAELAELVAELRPGHAIVEELRAWCATIVDPPLPPCRGRAVTPRVAAALPITRIQRAVADGVANGEVSAAAVGHRLGLSRRTLQRRLAAHGLTVQCLIEQSRRALAMERLRRADWRTAATELGYSDPRAFARAFKRWTRITPRAFQRAPLVTPRGCG